MLKTIIETALKAGAAIMEIYAKDFQIEYKDDKSPLTEADTASNKIIVETLLAKTPYPIISEEEKEVPYDIRSKYARYWLIDPIDGTKEFIKRNGEFTVNIALIENGAPIMGVVYAPVIKELYFADKEKGAYKASGIKPSDAAPKVHAERVELQKGMNSPVVQGVKKTKIKVVASKSHLSPETKDYIEKLKEKYDKVEVVSKGSSLKLCMVADGTADVYPRFAPTMEWDTGAGQAICEIAGYKVVNYPDMTPLRYNRKNMLNGWFIVK
jgi:3'(2'), 5'-bisphosphate nucleotidase